MVKNFGQNLFRFLCEGEFWQLVWFWMGDKKTAAPEGAAETNCFLLWSWLCLILFLLYIILFAI